VYGYVNTFLSTHFFFFKKNIILLLFLFVVVVRGVVVVVVVVRFFFLLFFSPPQKCCETGRPIDWTLLPSYSLYCTYIRIYNTITEDSY
jgi:hypothetical protein